MVVIAIIAILMSILLPSMRKAREKALSAVCKSNLKQMGVGYSLQLTKGGMRGAAPRVAGRLLTTYEIMHEIEKDMGIADKTINDCPLKAVKHIETPPYFGNNVSFCYWGDKVLTQVTYPAETIVMGDSDIRPWPAAVPYWLKPESISDFHPNKKMNILMFDFSVQSTTRSKYANLTVAPYLSNP